MNVTITKPHEINIEVVKSTVNDLTDEDVSEEYAAKLRRAGFEQVSVTITKPHEINIEVVRSTVNDLTDEDIAAIEGVSSSALITAVKP